MSNVKSDSTRDMLTIFSEITKVKFQRPDGSYTTYVDAGVKCAGKHGPSDGVFG